MKKLENKIENLKTLISNFQNLEGAYCFDLGSLKCYQINSPMTRKECQVFEIYESEGKDVFVGEHAHENSLELIYQIKGSSTFSDGDVLNSGDFKVIQPNEAHSLTVSKDSLLLTILQPSDNING